MPRSLLIFLSFLILTTATLSLVPTTSLHAGLIPCGLSTPDPDILASTDPTQGTARCTLCHLLVGFSRIVVFLRNIMAAVAVAVLVAMAIIYLTSGGNEGRMTFAKGGMFAALIGLGVVLLAWVTVNFILTLPIINTTTGLIRTGWDTVSCSTTSLSTGAVATTTPTPSTGGGGASGTGGGLGGGGDLVTLPRDTSGAVIVAPALPSPTNLTATATATDAITVTWASVPGATGYAIERCTGLTCITFTPLGTLTGTSFIDQGLASETGYSYHVQAISSAGVSGWTNVVGATTQGVPSNPYVYVPPVDDPYGTAGGGGTGTNGGGGNSCTIPAGAANPAGDTMGRGTWKPAGTSNLYVVDQSWPLSTPASTTYVPDCVNGGTWGGTPDCRDNTTPPVTISNNVISVRYVATSFAVPAQGGMFGIASEVGSGIPTDLTVSLTTIPGDFSSSVNPSCMQSWQKFSYPYLLTGGTGCPITPGLIYYLNLKSGPCSGNCTYKLSESNNLQGTSGTHPVCTSGSDSGSGSTAACSAGAQGDTASAGHGLWSGTWTPPGTNHVLVVDQSEVHGAGTTTSFPGCVNQKNSNWGFNDPCLYQVLTDTSYVYAIRYASLATLPQTMAERFQLMSGVGTNPGVPATVSLSQRPNDFSSSLPAGCMASNGASGRMIQLLVGGATGCPIVPNSLYYFNVKFNGACPAVGCTFKLAEPSYMQGTTVSC